MSRTDGCVVKGIGVLAGPHTAKTTGIYSSESNCVNIEETRSRIEICVVINIPRDLLIYFEKLKCFYVLIQSCSGKGQRFIFAVMGSMR